MRIEFERVDFGTDNIVRIANQAVVPTITTSETKVVPPEPRRRLTILHTVYGLAVGGLERQLATVVNQLPQDAFRHIVVVRGWDEAEDHVTLGDHVTVIREANSGADPHWSRRLAQVIDREQVDLVHARGMTMLVDVVIAARMMNDTPVLASFHGFEESGVCWSGVRCKLLREALHYCRARWAVSRRAGNAIAGRLNLPQSYFDVIPNGVDTDRFCPAASRDAIRGNLGIDENALVFLTVGNQKPVKGHDILLNAFAKIDDESRLIVVGRDYQSGQNERLAKSLRLDSRTCFAGPIANPLPYYQAADAFVLPSRTEGHCNSLLEAMATGLPVVATNVGGNPDVITNKETGLLVPADDIDSLADAMRTLKRDDQLRRQLATAGRAHVINQFSQHTMLNVYADRYRRTINEAADNSGGFFATNSKAKRELIGV